MIGCHQFAWTAVGPGRTMALAVQIFAEAFWFAVLTSDRVQIGGILA